MVLGVKEIVKCSSDRCRNPALHHRLRPDVVHCLKKVPFCHFGSILGRLYFFVPIVECARSEIMKEAVRKREKYEKGTISFKITKVSRSTVYVHLGIQKNSHVMRMTPDDPVRVPQTQH